jgi:small subunit ribosomal protein S16
MLTIKLSKLGKKNKKVFRVIISEKGRDPFGDPLEILGSYDQYHKNLQIKKERVNHWLSKGALMTPTVNNLLISQGVIEGQKAVASKAGKVSEKRQNQIKAKEDKRKKAAAATETKPEEAASSEPETTETAPEVA